MLIQNKYCMGSKCQKCFNAPKIASQINHLQGNDTLQIIEIMVEIIVQQLINIFILTITFKHLNLIL